jgi:hypothetical protein
MWLRKAHLESFNRERKQYIFKTGYAVTRLISIGNVPYSNPGQETTILTGALPQSF